MKTEYALYIYANTRYSCSKGDSDEFNSALDTFSKHELSPFTTFDESSYLGDYISGMYPEFNDALEYYADLAHSKHNEGRYLSDDVIYFMAKMTMRKFNLKKEYDFNCEPTEQQMRQINTRIKARQKSETVRFALGFLKNVSLALINVCEDYRDINKFLSKINMINGIVSGKYPEEIARKYQNKPGVQEGLEFLALKKQGIIDEELKITDIDKFCDSKPVRGITIGDKVYDLSENLRKIYGKPSNKSIRNCQQLNGSVRQFNS